MSNHGQLTILWGTYDNDTYRWWVMVDNIKCKPNILSRPNSTQNLKLIGWEIYTYKFIFIFTKLNDEKLFVTLICPYDTYSLF